ncbi:MAG: hypothetical protein AAF675_20755 [Pseudomonadota bacterium]
MTEETARDLRAPTEADVRAAFTRSDGRYRFARWGRPLAPAWFGFAESLAVWRAALSSAAVTAGLEVVEEDPELGANFLAFSVETWPELRAMPGIERLIPGIDRLLGVLQAAGANQYRIFGFEPAASGAPGAIRIAITLLRRDADLACIPEPALALGQCAQALLLWSDHAFTAETPVAGLAGATSALPDAAVLKPRFRLLLSAAYDPGLPDAAEDPGHAAALAAVAQQSPG